MVAGVDHRARYYNPTTGRFLSEDPAGFGGSGPNLYAYVGDNPVNFRDPTGEYGTNDCSYYTQRCQESGGKYYCQLAPEACNNWFPKYPDPDPNNPDPNHYEGWARCTRKCLQDCDKKQHDKEKCDGKHYGPNNPDPSTDSFWDAGHFACHAQCYTACAADGLPADPTPPGLP
jgi:hypothetical protein